MFSSWKLGRVAGIDLFLHPTFLLLLVLAYLFDGGLLAILFTVAVFGCVLLHEFGHALAARRFGIATLDITLYPIGGIARLERLPRAPMAELLITLAGPAVNLAIVAVLGLILRLASLVNPEAGLTMTGRFLDLLLTVNFLLAVFNLLPAFPMDGGRILRAALSVRVGRLRATEIAVAIGQALAFLIPLALMAWGLFNPFHLILAAFLFIAAGTELRQVRAEEFQRRWPFTVSPLIPQGLPTSHPDDGIWVARPIVIRIDIQDPRASRVRKEPLA